MTSSILVNRMRSYTAEHAGLDYKIGACSVNQVHQYASQADLLFIAPHLSYLKEELHEKYPEKELFTIPADIYSSIDAEKVMGLIHTDTKEEKQKRRLKDVLLKIASRRILRAISAAFTAAMPILIIGGFFTVLQNLPFPAYQEAVRNTGISAVFNTGADMTVGCISLYIAFLTAYHYGEEYRVSGPHAGINSLICFFLIMDLPGNVLYMEYIGTKGIFCAFITAYLSVHIYRLFSRASERFTRNLKSVPPQIYHSFFSLIPCFFSVLFFTMIAGIFRLGIYGSFPDFVYTYLQLRISGLMGEHILSLMLSSLLSNLFWFVGIHGGNIVNSVTNPILMPLSLENLQAYSMHAALPHIIHHKFVSICIFGGAGSTLALAALMCFRARSQRMKQLGRLSLPMGIFFINEPIILGLPVMMNPLMLIPFILVPEVSIFLTWLVMSAGIVPPAVGFDIPWTTPPVITGFIQGGWRLALWQVLLFLLQGILWYPFFRIQDQKYLQEESIQNSAASGGRGMNS